MKLSRWLPAAAAVAVAPLAAEMRWRRPDQPPSDRWRRVAVRPRGGCLLGVSFRPLQAEALGLAPDEVLRRALDLPIDILRVGAYWNRLEPRPGAFEPQALDDTLDRIQQAGRKVVLAVGAVKNFGYPEFFVPAHRLTQPLREGTLVTPDGYPELASAAQEFVGRVVERYRERDCIYAWQVEHEALDPLGLEHSWRLAREFVAGEVALVRSLDPGRPILMNGYVPTSAAVRLTQAWRTRGQGDSVAGALDLADLVGLDIYPRSAVLGAGGRTIYLDGEGLPWNHVPWDRLSRRARKRGSQLLVSEGQAEPWELQTVPPNPAGRVPSSCPPERLIVTYNRGLGPPGLPPLVGAYLFWGLEYWLRREATGDPTYLEALRRVLTES